MRLRKCTNMFTPDATLAFAGYLWIWYSHFNGHQRQQKPPSSFSANKQQKTRLLRGVSANVKSLQPICLRKNPKSLCSVFELLQYNKQRLEHWNIGFMACLTGFFPVNNSPQRPHSSMPVQGQLTPHCKMTLSYMRNCELSKNRQVQGKYTLSIK